VPKERPGYRFAVARRIPVKTARSDDARSFYQERLALLHRVGFALSSAFLVGVVLIRGVAGGSVAEELRSPSRWCHIAATLLTLIVWRFLARREHSDRVLDAIDAGGLLALSLVLNLNAGLFEIRTVSVFNLALTTGIAQILRAVLVPSTARRTLAIALTASGVAVAVFFLSALHPAWPIEQLGLPDWPLPYQLISLMLWLGTMVATATISSRVIYELRREARVARKLGQYVLGNKLGAGGMGIVYRATHAMLRRDTALKLLPSDRVDPTTLRRFEREVVQTARLRHPNTVAIFDYGRTLDGIFYYAMEFLDGVTIAKLVDDEGPLPPSRVVWLLAQVCASLDEAHQLGLVHRDVKPANIMVVGHPGAYDFVKVLDFGLVKTVDSGDAFASMTDVEKIVGTPLYMAPESITRPDEVDARADLYAVAAVGYFMLTGEELFDRSSLVEICAAHLYDAPIPIRERAAQDVPADLEELLLSALSKSPSERPRSAAAFRQALLACNVPSWTEEDARTWWQEREPAAAATPEVAAHGATVQVRLEAR
jgi:serine/threonine-protein kinase